MIVGVTASRGGLTAGQYQLGHRLLTAYAGQPGQPEMHMGDCLGGDEQLAHIAHAVKPKFRITAHPPIKGDFRAYYRADVILAPLPYGVRNQNIVNAVNAACNAKGGPGSVLLAFPSYPRQRFAGSGTWQTIIRAKHGGESPCPTIICIPDGRWIVYEDGYVIDSMRFGIPAEARKG